MSTIRKFLIVKADGEMRLAQRPRLSLDEIAIPIVVHMPEGWGKVVADQIDVHMPEPPAFEPVDDPIVVGGEAPT